MGDHLSWGGHTKSFTHVDITSNPQLSFLSVCVLMFLFSASLQAFTLLERKRRKRMAGRDNDLPYSAMVSWISAFAWFSFSGVISWAAGVLGAVFFSPVFYPETKATVSFVTFSIIVVVHYQ